MDVRRVLITGMSGTGKSTTVAGLADAGHRAVDLDTPAYSHEVDADPGELTGIGGGRDWVWREDRVAQLLDEDAGPVLFAAGTSPNQGAFAARFDAIVLLTAPAEVIVRRLAARTGDAFGTRPGQVARTLALQEQVEPLLRARATHEIDTRAPLDDVVATVRRIGVGG